ncbi:glutathione S-transferase 1-like [Aphomia sociella]
MARRLLLMAPASPPSRAVMMTAELIGLPLEYKEVKLLQFEQKQPEFLKLNPAGKVPVLIDGDLVLSESNAIMAYLVSEYADNKQRSALYPSESRQRAIIDQRMYFNATTLFQSLAVIVLPAILEGAKAPSPKQLKAVEESYGVLEQYLKGSRYVAADHLTIADLSVGSTATAINVLHKLDCNKHPRSAEWLSRIEEEPVFKKVNAPGVSLAAKMMKIFRDNNKNN